MRIDTYYAQTTEFTCGAACLMMAMRILDRQYTFEREEEFQIWREANSVFMGEGHPGCAPHALALAAKARGYGVSLWLWNTDDLFADWTRKRSHKNIMLMMEAYDIKRADGAGLETENRKFTPADLHHMRAQGYVPIVLTAEGIEAHWVVITHSDEAHIYAHDPYIDAEKNQQMSDCVNVKYTHKTFAHMTQYGRKDAQAVIFVSRKG